VDVIPEKFLKRIKGTDGLFEIRFQQGNNIYRIFCCFDKGRLVILFNGFVKKSRRTPKKEIELAVKLMSQYFEKKN
jgi:phage-related protein